LEGGNLIEFFIVAKGYGKKL